MDGMNNIAGGDGPSHDGSMEARVAVLEEIAAAIKQGLVDLRHDGREVNRRLQELQATLESDFRTLQTAQERDFCGLQTAQESDFRAAQAVRERDFRLLFGAIISVAIGLAALMGHGFHWF